MKKARVLKSWSKHNLPGDLWTEILSRVPVKSLLRFRCVSRSWKSRIDDYNFTRLHLNRFNNRPDAPILFVESQGLCVLKNSKTLRTISSSGFLRSDLESNVVRSFRWWYMVSSVDGLFLLQHKAELMLWNPSVKQYLPLPPLPEIPLLDGDAENAETVSFGLGFDPWIKDYKAVKFVTLPKEDVQFAAVYTLSTNSWKLVECKGEGRRDLAFHCWHSSVSFNGVIYGLARDYPTQAMKLVSFDLKSEVFASSELPVTSQPLGSKYYLTIFYDGCSLALVHLSEPEGSIWTLERLGDNTEMVNWIERYDFHVSRLDYSDFLCIKKNGEMLMKYFNMVLCYNLEAKLWTSLMVKNRKSFEVSNTATYVESLFRLS